METVVHNRSINRAALLVFVTALILILSWKLAAPPAVSAGLEEVSAYGGYPSARTSTSTDEQVRALQDRLRANPDDWQAYSQLGLAYLQKARETGDPAYYQKADVALGRALAVQPNDYATLSASGALALARHDFHTALDLGEQAVRYAPDRSYAYGVIADAQVELGRYTDAIETLQTMIDLRPDMSSYSRISYIRELYGDTDGALEMMQLAVDSGLPNAENTAWVRTQLGNLYFNMGDLERAELEYQWTLRDRPDYIYALAGLGRVRAAQGRMEEAIELLDRAVRIMPMPEFVITLGDLYQTQGQREAADQQFRLVAAIEQLYRANGVDMDMEIALFNADHDRNLPATLILARQAYGNRPSIHAADVLAWALYKTGDYSAAKQYAAEALRLGTKDALKLYHAGMIALQLGDEAQARAYLEQAIAINPHFSILYARQAEKTLDSLQGADAH